MKLYQSPSTNEINIHTARQFALLAHEPLLEGYGWREDKLAPTNTKQKEIKELLL